MKEEHIKILELIRNDIRKNGYAVEDKPFIQHTDFDDVEYSQQYLENQLSFLKENHVVELTTGVATPGVKRKIINKIRSIAVKVMNPVISQQNGVNTGDYEVLLQMYAYVGKLEKRLEELEERSKE